MGVTKWKNIHLNCLTYISSLLKEAKMLCPKPDILSGSFSQLMSFHSKVQGVTQMYFNYLYMENNGFQCMNYNFYYSKIEGSN